MFLNVWFSICASLVGFSELATASYNNYGKAVMDAKPHSAVI